MVTKQDFKHYLLLSYRSQSKNCQDISYNPKLGFQAIKSSE
jgi:hypothetical protein